MKRTLFVLSAITIVFTLISFSYALETITHEEINEHISKNTFNGFSLNSYIKNNLGIQKGIEESFDSKRVWQWMREGGLKEDVPYWYMPYLRSVNHFHNPLTDQGFSGIWGTGNLSGISSVIWAQLPKGVQWPGGYYSWQDTRDYFYNALTLKDKTDREKKFAEMSRGLGQVMHLVQDLSVPEHTRDDGHYFFYNYEKWVRDNIAILSQYNPIYFNSSAFGNINPLAPVPIANVFDTNQYNGTNPNVTLQGNVGLSEYTNTNFFSTETIFANDFPYPAWSSVVEYDETDASGKIKTYLKKIGDGEIINHLAAGKWFYKYLPPNLKRFGLKLDKAVYGDYAQRLIPRAVGYSAGLLNYFFRGEMDMIPDEAKGSGYVIVNNTDEDMSGQFELWYDNKDDERVKVSGASWTLSINKKSSSNNKSTNITFTPPDNAKEPGKYMLVFRGKLGNEEDAVVGKEIILIPPLVFLIYQDAQNNPVYAVWSIENDGKELKDYNFDISKYVNLISPGERHFPSKVKSNSELNKHTAMVKNFLSQRGFERYGIYKQDVDNHVYLSGLRNSYVNDVFDGSYAYMGYNTNLNYPPAYVCSGRNNWYKDSNRDIISDLELWKEGTKYRVKYKKNGTAQNGHLIDEDKAAILSIDKYVGYDGVGRDEVSDGIVEEALYGNCVPWYMYNGTYMSLSSGPSYKFGNVEIARKSSQVTQTASERVVSTQDGFCGSTWTVNLYTVGSSSTELVNINDISLLDYDNIMSDSLNPDETFIVFYKSSGTERKNVYDPMYNGGVSDSKIYFLNTTKYIMAYRTKGGALQKVEICKLSSGTLNTQTRTVIFPTRSTYPRWCFSTETWDDYGVWSCLSWGAVTSDVTTPVDSGERINDVSCKASKYYLVYSYIIERYVSPNSWAFQKRIIGVIDVKTGKKTEHEIDNELLGQYKDTFDKKLNGAIGFHNESMKKEE